MKSEKQITIMSHKYSDIFMNEIKNRTNIIEISIDQLHEIESKMRNIGKPDFKYNFIPFIQSGYFDVLLENKQHVAFYFECNEELFFEVVVIENFDTNEKIDIIGTRYFNAKFIMKIAAKIPIDISDETEIHENSIYDMYYTERNIKGYQNMIPDKFKSKIEEYESIFMNLFLVFGYINYLSQYPEYKIIDGKEKQTRNRTNKCETVNEKKEIKQKEIKIKSINLNGIRIISNNKKVMSNIKSRTPRKYAGTWSVCGHYRHYKNGQTIYIKPYQKGSGEKRIEKAKKYMINSL